jgi:hypothetical protein
VVHLSLNLDIERNPWKDLQEDPDLGVGVVERLGLLRNGMQSGAASVAVVVALPDGSHVIGETSWAALRTAFAGMSASPVVAEEIIGP